MELDNRHQKGKDQPHFVVSSSRSGRRGKRHLALRGVESLERLRGGTWVAHRGGDIVKLDPARLASLTLFGVAKEFALPAAFLDVLHQHRCGPPVVIADLEPDRLIIIHPHYIGGVDATTGLCEVRRSQKKRVHVARELIRAQLAVRGGALSKAQVADLAAITDVDTLRQFEAQRAKAYWAEYYEALGLPGLDRREPHAVNVALNATAHLLIARAIRALVAHRLPLELGLLHGNPLAAALAYDMVEPMRGYAERAVAEAVQSRDSDADLVGRACASLARDMEQPATTLQLNVALTRGQLIDLTVVSLRRYCDAAVSDESSGRTRFFVPLEGPTKYSRRVQLEVTLDAEDEPVEGDAGRAAFH